MQAVAERTNGKTTINIPAPKYRTANIQIEGISPLYQNRVTEETLDEMEAKQMKQAKKGRDARDPEADYKGAAHVLELDEDEWENSAFGHPADGIRAAIIRAGKSLEFTMTDLRNNIIVQGYGADQLVPIEGKPKKKRDLVRLNGRTGSIAYRPFFKEWSALVEVEFFEPVISADQLVQLFMIAGNSVGIGPRRPENNGSYGRFRVESVSVVD